MCTHRFVRSACTAFCVFLLFVQDTKKGKLRFYHGPIFWNYGYIPQTWEDPNVKHPEASRRAERSLFAAWCACMQQALFVAWRCWSVGEVLVLRRNKKPLLTYQATSQPFVSTLGGFLAAAAGSVLYPVSGQKCMHAHGKLNRLRTKNGNRQLSTFLARHTFD